jgi:hypothetical protein
VGIWHTTSLTYGKQVREDMTHKSALLSSIPSDPSICITSKLGMNIYKKTYMQLK